MDCKGLSVGIGNMRPDNRQIYDENWESWRDMKVYGPASRWLRSLTDDLLSSAQTDAIRTVLDVGCGEGTNTYFIANRLKAANVKGIDFSQTGIDGARTIYHLPNLSFECDLNAENLIRHYDLITCFEVLEHVEEWQNLLGGMASACNRYLLLSFPTGRMRPFEAHVGHLRNFKKREVEEYLKGCHFRPVRTYYAGFPFFSPLYRELCNLTDSASNSFTVGKYGAKQKLVSSVIYFLFRYLSTKHAVGDQFCGLFEKDA